MFKLAKPEEIGKYLAEHVNEKYASQRKFCEAWLEYEKLPVDNEMVAKKANKFTQIKMGNKGIQYEDFPAFCTLLDMSCEEILSAGEMFKPERQRLTNYAVAFSHDKNFWEEYIHDADNLILNADERGNTVLDYAVRFKNIDFINYLIDKGYIWFDNGKEQEYGYNTFGAGTSISKRERVRNYDYYLQPQLQSIAFRQEIITLAIEKNDLELLKEMRAREIPDYYNNMFYHYYYRIIGDFNEVAKGKIFTDEEKVKSYYNQDLIDNLSESDNDILDYFTDAFEIQDKITKFKDGISKTYEFTYFFISELLDCLIKRNHRFAETALKKAIK